MSSAALPFDDALVLSISARQLDRLDSVLRHAAEECAVYFGADRKEVEVHRLPSIYEVAVPGERTEYVM